MWSLVGGSVTGPSHKRKMTPNQDAYAFKKLNDGRGYILALSDGHGGLLHPYSDVGSKYAVASAIEEVSLFFEDNASEKEREMEWVKFYFETTLSKKIQERWLTKINGENPIAFGCTLLVAVILEDHIICLQLGDGKIALVYDDGAIYYPMMRDNRFLSNETSSLSEAESWLEMQVQIIPNICGIEKVALATDGVENAFPEDYYDDAQFFRSLTGSEEQLGVLLEEAAYYSKDDTTTVLGIRNKNTDGLKKLDESRIYISEVPLGYVPLIYELRLASYPRRIHLAIRLIYMLEARNRICPRFLSIKQIFMEVQSETLAIFPGGNSSVMSIESLCGLIQDLTGILCIEKTSKKLVEVLESKLSALRYDYHKSDYFLSQGEHQICFRGAKGTYELFYDSRIDLFQLMPLTGWKNQVVGRIVQHEKHPTIWGLQNLTEHTWESRGKRILPGRVLPLQDGISCLIFGIPVRFHLKINHIS